VKDTVEQNTAGIYCMWNRSGKPKNPDAKNRIAKVTTTKHTNPCKHSTVNKQFTN